MIKQLVDVVKKSVFVGRNPEQIQDSGGRFSAMTRWIEREMKRERESLKSLTGERDGEQGRVTNSHLCTKPCAV